MGTTRRMMVLAIAAVLCAGTAGATMVVVADYRDDFEADAPLTPGWQYLWNAPDNFPNQVDNTTGLIGDPSGYIPLLDAGSNWTGDGDTDGSDPGPDGYIRLHATGGHPGRPLEGVDRFSIAAFTVPFDGLYEITDSFLTRASSAGNGNVILVHVNADAPLLNKVVGPTETDDFDLALGMLNAGDTIYTAVGTHMSSSNDSFAWDFSVELVPEPATMLLLCPAVAMLVRRLRRRRR